MKPVHRDSQEIIPEAAIRPSAENENYHIGVSFSFSLQCRSIIHSIAADQEKTQRGGEGNAHYGKPEPEKHGAGQQGLADKLKDKLFGGKKHNDDGSTRS